jgi:hypothetical protein
VKVIRKRERPRIKAVSSPLRLTGLSLFQLQYRQIIKATVR